MAYETKYQLPFQGLTVSGNIFIKKKDWAGGITELRLRHDGLEVSNGFSDWFNPVIRQKAVFEFVNNAADFYEYMDLFELEEKEFQVVIITTNDIETITLFDGWLDVMTVSQKYVHNSTVTLTASNYMSKLKNNFDTELDTLQFLSLIDFINNTLLVTGKENNVNLNCHLAPVGHTGSMDTSSAFTLSGIYTELFWKNNIERNNSLEVLMDILTAFDCYVYWWDDNWWIERYRDIYAAEITAFRYIITNSYNYGSGVTAWPRTNTITDLQTLTWTGISQTIDMVPGFKSLWIFLNQKLFLNLVYNDFTDAISIINTDADPDLRSWVFTLVSDAQNTEEYLYQGSPTNFLLNAVQRNRKALGEADYSTAAEWVPWQGVATKFSFTNDTINTVLNFRWSQIFDSYFWTRSVDPLDPIANWTVQIYWYLRIAGSNTFIYWDGSSWTLDTGTTADKYNVIENTLQEFEDIQNGVFIVPTRVSISITDIGDPGLDGDVELIVCVGKVLCYNHVAGSSYVWPTNQFHREQVGDIIVTVVNEPQENLIKGELDNDVLELAEVEMKLFDSDNLNYANAVLTDTNYDERTVTWVEDDASSSPDQTLAEWNLISKFQLFNKNRKRISGMIKSTKFHRPFELFYDSEGDSSAEESKYLMMPESYWPLSDRYQISLYEYDNTETINLI